MPNNTVQIKSPTSPALVSETPGVTAGVTTGRAAGLDVPQKHIRNELRKENLVQTEAIYASELSQVRPTY